MAERLRALSALGFSSQGLLGGLQPPVAAVLGDLMTSSGTVHIWCTCIYKTLTHTYEIKI